jgi:hypothetical protein
MGPPVLKPFLGCFAIDSGVILRPLGFSIATLVVKWRKAYSDGG